MSKVSLDANKGASFYFSSIQLGDMHWAAFTEKIPTGQDSKNCLKLGLSDLYVLPLLCFRSCRTPARPASLRYGSPSQAWICTYVRKHSGRLVAFLISLRHRSRVWRRVTRGAIAANYSSTRGPRAAGSRTTIMRLPQP